MYELNLSNKFYRIFAVVSDKYGIDPLLDRVVPAILSVNAYTVHEVTQEERGSPDLISFREYGSEDFWWHILTYNGICRFRDVVEGLSLNIPDLGAMVAATNDAISDNPTPGLSSNIIQI